MQIKEIVTIRFVISLMFFCFLSCGKEKKKPQAIIDFDKNGDMYFMYFNPQNNNIIDSTSKFYGNSFLKIKIKTKRLYTNHYSYVTYFDNGNIETRGFYIYYDSINKRVDYSWYEKRAKDGKNKILYNEFLLSDTINTIIENINYYNGKLNRDESVYILEKNFPKKIKKGESYFATIKINEHKPLSKEYDNLSFAFLINNKQEKLLDYHLKSSTQIEKMYEKYDSKKY